MDENTSDSSASPKIDYLAVMGKKGTSGAEAGAHYDRMAAFKQRFQPEGGILGCVDVGAAALWWDYGRLELYQVRNLSRYIIYNMIISMYIPGNIYVESWAA